MFIQDFPFIVRSSHLGDLGADWHQFTHQFDRPDYKPPAKVKD